MTISGSSIATSLGLTGGVDMTALASQLAEAQFAQQTKRLAARSETLERRISLAGSIRSSLSQLASALGDRLRAGDLAPRPAISNAAVADVTAIAVHAGKASYSLEVLSLAAGQTLASPAYADGNALVGAGVLTLRFGEIGTAGFAADPARAELSLTTGPETTLGALAQAINASGAGLSAYVAASEAGAQLVIKGAEGQQSGFVIETTEDPAAPGLGMLAWQPGGDQARLLATARDAHFRLDGLLRHSPGNSVANAAPGLSLMLKGLNPDAPATIRFAENAPPVGGLLQDMTGALNEVASALRAATDAKTGALAQDSGARTLARNLAALGTVEIMPNAPPGAPRTLAELGLALGRDGSFRLDTAILNAALQRDPHGVTAMFTTGLHGIYASIDRLARAGTSAGEPGSLGGSIARYQAQSQANSKAMRTLDDDREALRASMVARFARVDNRVAASRSTLSFLQSQIEMWNAQSR